MIANNDPAADVRRTELLAKLVEAEHEYRHAQEYTYVAMVIRDAQIVEAVRGRVPQKDISATVGNIGQPNVSRAKNRAITRRDVVPDGMTASDEAMEETGLGPAQFMHAVRNGVIKPVPAGNGVWAFRPEDVRALKAIERAQ